MSFSPIWIAARASPFFWTSYSPFVQQIRRRLDFGLRIRENLSLAAPHSIVIQLSFNFGHTDY